MKTSVDFRNDFKTLHQSICDVIKQKMYENKAFEIDLDRNITYVLSVENEESQFADTIRGINTEDEPYVIVASENGDYDVPFEHLGIEYLFTILEEIEADRFEINELNGKE